MKDLYVSSLLDVYGEFLSDKQKLLTEYYYNDDLSLSEIAENEGITRQGASDIIKRSVALMEHFEEKCHYCEKFLKLKTIADELRQENTENLNSMLDIIDDL